MSWQNLEDMMTDLLALDKAITVPGSGNGKGEEDVIGLSTITQCKYSDKVNVSILRKDIDRLLAAAELQQKMPIFVTENNGLILVTIPDSPILKDVLYMIVSMSLLKFVEANCENVKTKEERKEYRKLIYRSDSIRYTINNKYEGFSLDCRMKLKNTIEENLNYLDSLKESTDEK